jgi:murein DD-endopeptidase MepM/ murein hydrolase activator NlpD
MKTQISICFLLFLTFSCGDGVNELTHQGICDGYLDWTTSDYVLPYPSSQSHEVTQGNCGAVSHLGSQQYAYDFAMNRNDSIVAARGGTVYEVVESNENDNGCPDDNHVYIEHSDGTVATYSHLTKNGALVEVGDVVSQGDAIGLAGNTGCSSGDHLHFVVFRNKDRSESLPVTFRNTLANQRGLKPGTSYRAN